MTGNTHGNDKRPAIKYYLQQIYDVLYDYFGDLHWWPADSPFEVIVGAILTQNTAWRNVAAAIEKLKETDILTPEGISRVDIDTLAALIRPSGYYHIKARRLKAFIHYLHTEYNGNVENLFHGNIWQIRETLLKINGIGEETADSILLYAGGKPVFVVDAYTRRILERHDLVKEKTSYREIQSLFMTNLPHSVSLYNKYHALLVNTGKMFCTKKKLCGKCPLKNLPVYAPS
jgi:endonuclease-3 related protein